LARPDERARRREKTMENKETTERDGNGTGVDAGTVVSNGPDGKNKDSRREEGAGETKGIYDTPCQ